MIVSGKPHRRCFCTRRTTEHDLRRRSNTHLSSHQNGVAPAVRSATVELHSAAHLGTTTEADKSIGTTAHARSNGCIRLEAGA
jgi:hypothetical protein